MTAVGPPGAPAPGRSRFRAWLGGYPAAQVLLFVLLLAGAAALGRNLAGNMAAAGISPGFAFLGRPANFEIGEALVAYSAQASFGRALLVGILNTGFVSLVACVAATVLGVLLGVGRLSANPLLAGAARAYVEAFRNTPLLLQLFFWTATLQALPGARQAAQPLPGVYLSNRGIFMPALRLDGPGWFAVAVILLAVAAGWVVLGRRCAGVPPRRRARRIGLVSLGLVLAAAVASSSGRLDVPLPKGFNIVGGVSLTTEFSALTLGLVFNAAAGIAEIVRSSIQAVPHGQWEAAEAVGLRRGQVMRLVVLPQALRIIVPLMTSSYLSLVKNSSLAVAIGYPDLVSIANTAANQTGQALETMLIMMAVYLGISFSVSLLMNRYHARHASRLR